MQYLQLPGAIVAGLTWRHIIDPQFEHRFKPAQGHIAQNVPHIRCDAQNTGGFGIGLAQPRVMPEPELIEGPQACEHGRIARLVPEVGGCFQRAAQRPDDVGRIKMPER